MKTHSRFERARKLLLFFCLFIGLGAVAGAAGMLVKPDGSALGMQALLPFFQALPFAPVLFQDFVFPGIALLCVNGIPNLIAAALLLGRRRGGVALGGALGVTLMLWITIQFVIFPFNFMSTAYFFFGAAQAAAGYAAHVFAAQERFDPGAQDEARAGTNARELVVYFSRMGYAKKLALETARRSGAAALALTAAERTQGTAGFWWCGRYGMHRRAMPIEPVAVDLTAYDKVTLVTPIWVFSLCAPMRSFCEMAAGRIARADCVLVHYQKCAYENAAREIEELLGLRLERVTSVCCRRGKFLRADVLRGGEDAAR